MKKQFHLALPLIGWILITLLFSFRISAQTDTLAVEKVAGNIWMLRQNSAGNIGVFASNDGFIIVDDQFRTDSEKIRQALAKIANLPVKYIINTHWHADHSEGNENFARTGSVIVAHENSRQRLTTDQFVELFQMLHAARPWEGLPSVTFTQDFSFYERGETIHVFHVPNAHTDGDAIVHFQTSNVLHMGDLVIWWGLPFIDDHHGGSVNGIIAAVERVIPLCNDETRIIPGHGKAGTKQDLMDYLQMLKVVRDKVSKGVEQGKTLEQIIAEKPAGSFFSFISPDEFVKVVWRGLQQ